MQERERILDRTNRGYDIFTHYIKKDVQRKMFANPFRADSSPSCRLYYNQKNGGIWFMVDYGASEWSGDCFSVVAKSMHMNTSTEFRELLKTIDKEMDLHVMDDEPVNYHPVKKVSPQAVDEGPVAFKANYQAFKAGEIRYWQRYGITPEILAKYEVKSLFSCKFFPKGKEPYTYHGSYMEPMYGYTFNSGSGIKVYRPFSKTRFLYGGHLPKPYVFGWKQLPASGDVVIITGGEKDTMTLAAHGFTALAFNSESAKISEEHMKELSERFHHIVFMYDCDETGKRESAARLEEFTGRFHVSQLVLPLSGSKREKDISDYFHLGYTSENFQQLLQKNISINYDKFTGYSLLSGRHEY